MLSEFRLGKVLIQVDLECGLYFRLDKDFPEGGYCLEKTVMPAILAIYTENVKRAFFIS